MKARHGYIIRCILGIVAFLGIFVPPYLWLWIVSSDDGSSEKKDGSVHLHLNEWGVLQSHPSEKKDNSLTTSGGFVQDALCRGCRHALASSKLRCGATLPGYPKDEASYLALQLAAAQIAAAYPYNCLVCDPKSCSSADKQFWRYDRVFPRAFVSGERAQPLILSSLPKKHRIPATTRNVTTYFHSSADHVYPSHEYLFAYNPSIVILPQALQLTIKSTLSFSKQEPVYLASFRVSNQNYCFHPADQKVMNGLADLNGNPTGRHKLPAKNWLGLALMNSQLQILVDTVLDLQQAKFSEVEDFRLFVLEDQVYIASYDILAPFYFEPGEDRVEIPTVFEKDSSSFGTVYVRSFVSCAPCERARGYCGKNFNYFTLQSMPAGTALTEIWPSPPHMVRSIDLKSPCNRGLQAEQFLDQDKRPPKTSFATVESIYFPHLSTRHSLLTRGRGGACCIKMERRNSTFLVGIRHSKTPSQGNRLPKNLTDNHYLSQLYAFEPVPPFRIVAQSGYFCLGFGSDNEHPMVRLTNWRKLQLGTEFNCPRIHFVSGLTLSVDDPSLALVAWGVNDCYSRIEHVRVSDLEKLLFETPG